jgi:16S rRNA (guanine527-N7)-methyltransferase
MGSGAGFPGLVLAILTDHKLHLIESIGKKANFLSTVAEELKLDVTVHPSRIESLKLRADIITARALKALPELLVYANYLIKKDSICIFPKGQKLDEELTEAAKCWKFEVEKKPSLSDPSGTVLILRHLSWKDNKHNHGRK